MSRHPRISLDLLRAFRAAGTHLSFTRAAREQFVTQSAISHSIGTLELQLGQALFHRVNRSLKLTHAGEALYRATDEALAIIDGTVEELAGSDHSLGVTTTAALASLWLVPRLRQFSQSHPETNVRVVGTNDRIEIEREHLDLAIHFVPSWEAAPGAEKLVDYLQFPVCSPALARGRKLPLHTPTDLRRHVRLDFETIVYGRPWYDWEKWSDAMKLRSIAPRKTMRFSHYDQVIQAAIDGTGVAIGKWPHLARHLREGVLCAPLGKEWVARLGGFYLIIGQAGDPRVPIQAFVSWLRDEVKRDARTAPARLGLAKPSPHPGAASTDSPRLREVAGVERARAK
jgi:DNA-binding transcriptional LysR family regulator